MFKSKFPFVNLSKTTASGFLARRSRLTLTMDVLVVCDGKGEAPFQTITSIEEFPFAEVKVGSIIVTDRTSWPDLDSLVVKEFKCFYKNTYAYCGLGLNTDSIYSYEIGTMGSKSTLVSGASVLREPKYQNEPDKLPYQYINVEEDCHRIRIYLKGAAQNGATDSISFQTQVSKAAISQYVDRLSTGRIIFCGPRFVHNGIDMIFVAKRLAEYFVVANRHNMNSTQIASFNANDRESNDQSLEMFIDDMTARFRMAKKSTTSSQSLPAPHVVVIENLHLVTSNIEEIVETLAQFRDSSQDVPFVIGTFVTARRVIRPSVPIPYGNGV